VVGQRGPAPAPVEETGAPLCGRCGREAQVDWGGESLCALCADAEEAQGDHLRSREVPEGELDVDTARSYADELVSERRDWEAEDEEVERWTN
jgi:hypothetical protein